MFFLQVKSSNFFHSQNELGDIKTVPHYHMKGFEFLSIKVYPFIPAKHKTGKILNFKSCAYPQWFKWEKGSLLKIFLKYK